MDQNNRQNLNNESGGNLNPAQENNDLSWDASQNQVQQQPAPQANQSRISISLFQNTNADANQNMDDEDDEDDDYYDDNEDDDSDLEDPLMNQNMDNEEEKINLASAFQDQNQNLNFDEDAVFNINTNFGGQAPTQNASVIRFQNPNRMQPQPETIAPYQQNPNSISLNFGQNQGIVIQNPDYIQPEQQQNMFQYQSIENPPLYQNMNQFESNQPIVEQNYGQINIPMNQMDQQQVPMLMQISIPQDNIQFDQQQQPLIEDTKEKGKKHKKKTGKKNKKKQKSKREESLMSFYKLVKTKQTIEIDPILKKMRAQTIFILDVKEEESFNTELKRLQGEESGSHKIQLNLSLFAKMINILEVSLISKEKEKTPLLFDYAKPEDQSKFQNSVYSKISRDLHSQETKQKQVLEQEQLKGHLTIQKVLRVNLKKDVEGQFPPRIRILVSYLLDKITEFGIKSVTYKLQNQHLPQVAQLAQRDQLLLSNEQDCGQYFYTSDHFNSNFLWMPIIAQTSTAQIKWTLRYLVPTGYEVVSSGHLISRQKDSAEFQRTLFTYKLRSPELASAQQIGFICGQFPYIHKLTDLSNKCSQITKGGIYSFFLSEKKLDTFKHTSFYEKNLAQIINYLEKLLNSKYPCVSTKLVFVPNLFTLKNRKQSVDYGGGVHIFDEELLFNRNQLENRYRTYKHLTIGMAFDYFGNKIFEESPEDYWLVVGIRESIGNHFKITKCGVLLYRYHMMKTIESVYKKMKKGIERTPISSGSTTNQSSTINPQAYLNQIECYYNELFYEKCELIMHMIESMIDKSYYERIIRQLYQVDSSTISSGLFMKIFKDVCGFKLKSFCQNWLLSTSCPKLEAQFSYNKKNNSLDLSITQQSAMKYHFMFKRYLKSNVDNGTLYSNPYQYPEFIPLMKAMEPVDSFYVELKRECSRWFTGEVNVMIYLTDGAEIQTQQQKMSLKYGKTTAQVNIPLHCKVKKTIQNKKKEYENMLMFEDDDDEDMEDASENNGKQNMRRAADGKGNKGKDQYNEGKSGGNAGIDQNRHQFDNSTWKFGLNDFELDQYPYGTKNLFEVKNLDSPVLWIRIDPDMEFIRKVKVVQNENNWLFQLLSEKDVIGQIEAIRELGKITEKQKSEALGKEKCLLIYEILQTVSNNETYFFKVRKEALKALQKIQTTQFHQFLSLEKILTSIFKQKNLDSAIDLYKSNDFTKILEYFMDKYIIKTLAKCKEQQLTLKKEIQEKIDQKYSVVGAGDQINQQQIPQAPSAMSISINIAENEIISTSTKPKVVVPQIDERKFCVSSESIATLLIKLLSENDNSLNPFDDSFYLKQIIKSLGSLDSFIHMEEIGKEIYRQFKLDHIGSFSPQFALTKGAVAGYFNLRKSLYVFRNQKAPSLEEEELDWYWGQAKAIEAVTLRKLNTEIMAIIGDQKWPLDVRDFVVMYSVKHEFKYKNNPFLKALFILLKQADLYQLKEDFTIAQSYMRNIVYFLEKNFEILDYREAYLNTDRARAIATILWQFLCLPHSYLDSLLTYWVKRLYSLLYNNEVPTFMQEICRQEGLQMAKMDIDEEWMKKEDQFLGGGNLHDDRKKQMNRNLAQRSAQVIVRSPMNMITDNTSKIIMNINQGYNQNRQQQYQHQQSMITTDDKLKIVLDNPGGALFRQNSNAMMINNVQELQKDDKSRFRISLGGVYQNSGANYPGIERQQSLNNQFNQQQDNYMNESSDQNNYDQNRNDQDMDENNEEGSDNESIYDEFAAVTFEGWMQSAWEMLGVLWYHEEAGAFLHPVTEDDLGDMYDTYVMSIAYPMDFSTIKAKMYNRQYRNFKEFKLDVLAVFSNCMNFNHESSEIHQAASKLEKLFWDKMIEYQMLDERQTVRIF